jgi:hypothetical protein
MAGRRSPVARRQGLSIILRVLDNSTNYLTKGVADVAEAVIGAAFQTGGRELGLKVVKSLHIPLPFIESWEDFALKAKAPPPHVTVALKDDVLETIETIAGAKFRRPHILAQALVSIPEFIFAFCVSSGLHYIRRIIPYTGTIWHVMSVSSF